jgi:alkanesulfonate monooxygenase SsuD/methylene tetrahydromethanopterin reductase-like flavin-dependent oxidoreductase (luciferase family)
MPRQLHLAVAVYGVGGPGAFVADVERNVFLDPAKLHALDHVGEHFKVAGPLNLSRSRQGQPVIFQAGVSEDGRNLAAHVAEGINAPGGSLDEARAYYGDVKRRAAAKGGRTRGLELVRRAREQALTLRQVVETVTEYHPSPFTGAPDTVADAIADWYQARAADGLNLRFRTIEDLQRFADDVVPALQKRGVFRTEYQGDTLRANLGLPVPANRYTRPDADHT